MESKDMDRRIALMNAELGAARDFAQALRRHNETAVVDDDYPRVRYEYDAAARRLIEAFKNNGRLLT